MYWSEVAGLFRDLMPGKVETDFTPSPSDSPSDYIAITPELRRDIHIFFGFANVTVEEENSPTAYPMPTIIGSSIVSPKVSPLGVWSLYIRTPFAAAFLLWRSLYSGPTVQRNDPTSAPGQKPDPDMEYWGGAILVALAELTDPPVFAHHIAAHLGSSVTSLGPALIELQKRGIITFQVKEGFKCSPL